MKHYCRCCDLCSSRKGPAQKQRAPMKQYNVGAPMERVAIDVLHPLPLSHHGNKYLLIATDKVARRLSTAKSGSCDCGQSTGRGILLPLWCATGITLRSRSQVFQEVCKLLQINKTRTTPLHPQSDGMVERMNCTLEAQLAMFVDEHQTNWDSYIPLPHRSA